MFAAAFGDDDCAKDWGWNGDLADAEGRNLGGGDGVAGYVWQSAVYRGDKGGSAGCSVGVGLALSSVDDFDGGVDAAGASHQTARPGNGSSGRGCGDDYALGSRLTGKQSVLKCLPN